ncbi:type I-E CRISPR-associated endoribonuclease Cas2e [Sulfobacillus thermosulfidooxidans]|uniref:type I-E CRISPR-associated endoribonuclease Cas2e n=1 Tax=Sulfobacillus thermosulfidooxidans TaxID=28034 RepID=UPI00192A8B51|nr:type I-E CRISPR-associated endoribonuclease Cas2e [Sulfobacillus thermosulfidooxidans]
MTVVVTRNVGGRIRGFLASSLLELAPGVYSAPRISPAVRDRIWSVLEEWFTAETDASIIMLWRDPGVPGGQSVKVLGYPPITLLPVDGIVLAGRIPTGQKK